MERLLASRTETQDDLRRRRVIIAVARAQAITSFLIIPTEIVKADLIMMKVATEGEAVAMTVKCHLVSEHMRVDPPNAIGLLTQAQSNAAPMKCVVVTEGKPLIQITEEEAEEEVVVTGGDMSRGAKLDLGHELRSESRIRIQGVLTEVEKVVSDTTHHVKARFSS
jgi:hypothetical protein